MSKSAGVLRDLSIFILLSRISTMVVFGDIAQVEIVELINDGTGLAFGIVGGRSSGVVIKTILPGGVADRDGRLRSGDLLLRIGCVSVVGMCARQAAAVLRQCGTCVRLLVARPADTITSQIMNRSNAPIVPSRLVGDPIELERYLISQGYIGFGVMDESNTISNATIIEERHLMKPIASIVAVVPRGALRATQQPTIIIPDKSTENDDNSNKLPLDMALRGGEPETLTYSVELSKDTSFGLGITVAGYVCEQEELSGIFVKSVSTGSAAALSRQIQVNDRIIEVNGISLTGVSNHKAVSILRDAKGPTVKLKMIRYLRGAGFEKLQKALSGQESSPIGPPSPSVTSLTRYSFSVYEESTIVEPEYENPHVTSPSDDREFVIGCADDTSDDVIRIRDKWREILEKESDWPGYEGGYQIVVGTVMKDDTTGLGISLEGTVRVENGKEVKARHYIRSLAPSGPVALHGIHRAGDELLEVNNWRVLGSHHVDVVSRLRNSGARVTLVCARRKSQTNTALIDIGQDLNAFRTRNILGGSLQTLIPPHNSLIKAKSESSIASLASGNTILEAPENKEFETDSPVDGVKTRSLEHLSGLPMWSDDITYIDLKKEDRGLGFSILDYVESAGSSTRALVVRSVASGGAAAKSGLLHAGDRLLSVNGIDLKDFTLSEAVRTINSAPIGTVRLGVAKPLPSSTVVGGAEPKNDSFSSQKLEYFRKLLALIMSLHRDVTHLEPNHEDRSQERKSTIRNKPKIIAKITTK